MTEKSESSDDVTPEQASTPEATSAAEPAATLEPAVASEPVASEPVATPDPAVVYVSAPPPPKMRGARGVGAVVVLLGAGLFALTYALLVAIVTVTFRGATVGGVVASLAAPAYWVPIVVFAFSYLLLVIIVNRAGWWAHVLGGFIVAVVVYVAFIGAVLIQQGAVGADSALVSSIVVQQLTNPLGFVAAIAAREVPIWVGGLVAKRGRVARARNLEAKAAYERELAEHRATVSPASNAGGRTAV